MEKKVLILILLEMRLLLQQHTVANGGGSVRLNPYSTGNEVVAKMETTQTTQETKCLNPYSTGNEVVAKH